METNYVPVFICSLTTKSFKFNANPILVQVIENLNEWKQNIIYYLNLQHFFYQGKYMYVSLPIVW